MISRDAFSLFLYSLTWTTFSNVLVTVNGQLPGTGQGGGGGLRLNRLHANSDNSASGRAKRESGPQSPGGGGGKPVNW